MIVSRRSHAQVRIVQSRRFTFLEIRAFIYDFRQRLVGKSSGPQEVKNLIKQQSSFGKVRESQAHRVVDNLWIPANEELLTRVLESKVQAHRLFIGPNIAIEKPKLSELILQIPNSRVLVPSASMRDILLDRKLGYTSENILIWFAGVDQEFWKPTEGPEKNFVLVYQKGPDSEERVKIVEKSLLKLKIPSATLRYGEYRQGEYFRLLNKCKFVIWVGHTETQGIAQFQAWAMNVPTLVSGLPKRRLEERDGLMASAAPYLNEKTGILARREYPSLEEIMSMNNLFEDYSPRLWVTENATRELTISNLVKIFDDSIAN